MVLISLAKSALLERAAALDDASWSAQRDQTRASAVQTALADGDIPRARFHLEQLPQAHEHDQPCPSSLQACSRPNLLQQKNNSGRTVPVCQT